MFDNWFQFLLFVAVILAIFVFIIVGIVGLFQPTIDDNYEVKRVYVQRGATLWEFYTKYAPNADWVEWLDKVQKLNNMHSSNINAGDYIEIYAEK